MVCYNAKCSTQSYMIRLQFSLQFAFTVRFKVRFTIPLVLIDSNQIVSVRSQSSIMAGHFLSVRNFIVNNLIWNCFRLSVHLIHQLSIFFKRFFSFFTPLRTVQLFRSTLWFRLLFNLSIPFSYSIFLFHLNQPLAQFFILNPYCSSYCQSFEFPFSI